MKWFFLLMGLLTFMSADILVVVLVQDGIRTVLHEIQIVLLVFLSMFCFGLFSLLNLLGVMIGKLK